jgi:hypothetical protein
MNSPFIEAIENDHQKLRDAIAGLTAAQMQAFPVPGTWSIQQIVIHVVDSDIIAACRMKRIIAMELPLMIGYDETLFAKNLHYHEQSVEDALEMLRLSGRQLGRILRALPDSALERKGIHNEIGAITLGWYMQRIAGHTDHHLKFIQQKRKMVESIG